MAGKSKKGGKEWHVQAWKMNWKIMLLIG